MNKYYIVGTISIISLPKLKGYILKKRKMFSVYKQDYYILKIKVIRLKDYGMECSIKKE